MRKYKRPRNVNILVWLVSQKGLNFSWKFMKKMPLICARVGAVYVKIEKAGLKAILSLCYVVIGWKVEDNCYELTWSKQHCALFWWKESNGSLKTNSLLRKMDLCWLKFLQHHGAGKLHLMTLDVILIISLYLLWVQSFNNSITFLNTYFLSSTMWGWIFKPTTFWSGIYALTWEYNIF